MEGVSTGYDRVVNAVFVVTGIMSVVAVLAWIGLLVWGAIEDGRADKADTCAALVRLLVGRDPLSQ